MSFFVLKYIFIKKYSYWFIWPQKFYYFIIDCTSRAESLYDGIVDDSRAVYAVFLSFAEIYNEYIYDLLDRNLQSKKGKKNPLVLGEDLNGSIYIKGTLIIYSYCSLISLI